jgi:sporulation protein YlmC with PRC-barrel domain
MKMRPLALATALLLSGGTWAAAQAPPPAPAPAPSPAAGPDSAAPKEPGAPASVVRQIKVDDLEDLKIYGADGKEIGEIEEVVQSNADKKQLVVIERGGFLGVGARKVALPLESIQVQGDRAVLLDMDPAKLDSMPEFTNTNDAFRELDDDEQLSLPQR